MRVLYDHQVFSLQNSGGASRYFYELACNLGRKPELQVSISLGLHQSVYAFHALAGKSAQVLGWKARVAPGLLRYALNEVVTGVWNLAGGKWTVYHPTLYRAMPGVRCEALIATHHDCVQEKYPDLFPDWRRVENAKKRLYKDADGIICVSESSRNDLLTYYDVNQSKTCVVYHGRSELTRNEMASSDFINQIRRPYFLYVGSRHEYKNFKGLLRAYREGHFYRDFDLVLLGGGRLTEAEKGTIERFGIAKFIIHRGLATEYLLAEAYARAHLFVYPSLYEGFGFPPLEAMGLGCPVLAARSSSIPEVCGESVFYFDPSVDGDLERGLRASLDEDDRAVHMDIARRRVAQFNWENCAERTESFYKQVLGKACA